MPSAWAACAARSRALTFISRRFFFSRFASRAILSLSAAMSASRASSGSAGPPSAPSAAAASMFEE